jgi:hypothetical protein
VQGLTVPERKTPAPGDRSADPYRFPSGSGPGASQGGLSWRQTAVGLDAGATAVRRADAVETGDSGACWEEERKPAMFEAKNKPLRPPLQTAPQTRNAHPTDSQRPKPASLSNARRSARRAHMASGGQKNSKVSETFTAAREMTTRAAQDIIRQFGEGLTREECLRPVSARSGREWFRDESRDAARSRR